MRIKAASGKPSRDVILSGHRTGELKQRCFAQHDNPIEEMSSTHAS